MIISESIKNRIQELGLEGNQIKEDLTNRTGKLLSKQDPPIGCRNKPRLKEGGLITVCVELGILTVQKPLTLRGFKAANTISDVKDRVCQEALNIGWGPLHLGGPMRTAPGRPGRRHLEDNETLASLFYPGCRDLITTLYCTPDEKIEEEPKEKKEMDWLSVCKHVRFREEAHEENTGSEDYYKGCPISIVKRPKTIQAPLPFAELSHLGIHGQYQLMDSKNRFITFSRIMFAVYVETTASAILLAPNDEIFKDLVLLNSESKYLVVRVYWDRLSYIFLRIIRSSYMGIPIVAVTDLDPHHLDLLTFLDTPPKELPNCYGWDLSRDFEDFGTSNIDFLNIRWLGLRPSDCEKLLSFDGARCPPGFDAVIRMLRANPFLLRKKEWLEALDWLQVFGKSVSFHPPAPTYPFGDCYLHLGDDFIANKLSKKDWV